MELTDSAAYVAHPGVMPGDDEVDVFGLTHTGKSRAANMDHFLICSLRKELQIHGTSLPDSGDLGVDNDRLAFFAMVADGVGSGEKAQEASRLAVATITKYVSEALRTYYTADSVDPEVFARTLEDAALSCHRAIEGQALEDRDLMGMATTLTLWIGMWPKAYLLQVGDSRCYVLRGDKLTQISRDQTMAQDFIDQGIFTVTDARGSRLEHVLSSSIGGPQSMPVVTTMDQDWNNVGLLCSDGLTKHVSDERIEEVLKNMTSAKQACEDLLQEALDDGGSDNITIVIGRDTKKYE
jgi:serine/threonine protein phosphatase PrpC